MENSVYTNKKFKEAVLELSKDCDNVEIYFDVKKYAGFRKTEFTGDYEGYDFIIQGKCEGKWYEMSEPYHSDLKEFLQEIGDNEIDKLDDKLFIDCLIETDWCLVGGKIEWSDNVPENIKEDFEEDNGEDGEGILNFCDWDSSGDLEFYKPYNNITWIQVKIKKGEKEHEIKWLNKNYYNEG
jgi:hypothetical protein|tara:strand:+ start:70 stop:615 length:546 start_codon:yes stop_codon:yes gene_type:complete